MREINTESLEAAARAHDNANGQVHRLFGGYDYSSYGRSPPYVVKDERGRKSKIIWEGDDHEESERQYAKATNDYVAQAVITAFLAAEAERGYALVPREASPEMIVAGVAERHGQPVPEAWSLATANIWREMFDAAAPIKPSEKEG